MCVYASATLLRQSAGSLEKFRIYQSQIWGGGRRGKGVEIKFHTNARDQRSSYLENALNARVYV